MFRFALMLALAAPLSACTGGATTGADPGVGAVSVTQNPASAAAPTVIALRYDKTVEYGELELRWRALEDSRCPIGVTCVWAGQMLATIEIAKRDEAPLEVELLRRTGREPVVSRAFGYELRLLEVEPHPKENVTPSRGDYVMRIEIASP
jgi:hypothetical protein